MTKPTNLKADWLNSSAVERVVNALGVGAIKFVGGAVRDTLAGRHVSDIDAATIHKPETTMTLLEEADIKAIPTGLKHGTVTAVSSGVHIEITTLRVDVETDGRHAEVAFTESWLEDAKRRDFTINSLYCAPDGELFDPFGGVDDLKAARVRFIGNAEARIKEDALRIMRFFRFTARYGQVEPDAEGMNACSNLRSMIGGLSIERVRDEFLKMMALQNFMQPIRAMQRAGILGQIYGADFDHSAIEKLSTCEERCGVTADALARFYLLSQGVLSATEAAKKFHLSNADKNRIHSLEALRQEARDDVSVERLLYIYSPWAVGQYFICEGSSLYTRYADVIKEWSKPVFPIQGKDLLALGFKAGPALGARMKELEQTWIESEFKLSREELLVI